MKSNFWRHDLTNLSASARSGRQLTAPILARHCLMKAWWSRSISTLTTRSQPLDSSSSVMLPVPEKRSRACFPSRSMYPASTLNMFSLAKSVVGLALNERGMSKRRPLYNPVIILILSSAFHIVSYQIVGHALDERCRRTVEVAHRVYHIGPQQKLPELFQYPLPVGNVAHDVHLVVLGLQRQLLPDVEKEVQSVVCVARIKGVAVLETVLGEAEHLQFLVVEIAVQLAARAYEAALVQVFPHGSHGTIHPHVGKMVVDNELKVLVDREECHGVELGQDVEHHPVGILLRERVAVESVGVWLAEHVDRHHEHGRIDHEHGPLEIHRWQLGGLECLAQVGRHGYSAPHGVGFECHSASLRPRLQCRKRKRMAADAYCEPPSATL